MSKIIKYSYLMFLIADIVSYQNGTLYYGDESSLNKKYEESIEFSGMDATMLKIVTFFQNGGFEKINLEAKPSYCSHQLMITSRALLKCEKNNDNQISKEFNQISKEYRKIIKEEVNKEIYESISVPKKIIDNIKENTKNNIDITDNIIKKNTRDEDNRKNYEYEYCYNLPIGYVIGIYYDDIDKVIKDIINLYYISQYNILSMISTIIIGIMTIMAKKNKRIDINEIINIIKSKKIDNLFEEYIKKITNKKNHNKVMEIYIDKKDVYIKRLNIYLQNKNKAIMFQIYIYRPLFYYRNIMEDKDKFTPGHNSIDAVIMIIDILNDCKYFEDIFITSIMHPGESNITGSISMGLYILINGKNKILNILIKKKISYGQYIKKIAKKIIKKIKK